MLFNSVVSTTFAICCNTVSLSPTMASKDEFHAADTFSNLCFHNSLSRDCFVKSSGGSPFKPAFVQ